MSEPISGIYLIQNTINGKCYVGSSTDIYRRWSVHRCNLKSNCHHSPRLQGAWNKYGEKSFRFMIIDYCLRDELYSKELAAINEFSSFISGYNSSPTPEGAGRIISEETRNKQRDAANQVALRPGEKELRSERATKQHEEKNFGRHSWSEQAKEHQTEEARKIAKTYQPWKHVYKNVTRQEVWTSERRAAAAERARKQMTIQYAKRREGVSDDARGPKR